VREDAEPRALASRLVRASEEEKRVQIEAVAGFKRQHADKAPQALKPLQEVVDAGGNTFAELVDTVRDCSLGQITQALYEVGWRYRRRHRVSVPPPRARASHDAAPRRVGEVAEPVPVAENAPLFPVLHFFPCRGHYTMRTFSNPMQEAVKAPKPGCWVSMGFFGSVLGRNPLITSVARDIYVNISHAECDIFHSARQGESVFSRPSTQWTLQGWGLMACGSSIFAQGRILTEVLLIHYMSMETNQMNAKIQEPRTLWRGVHRSQLSSCCPPSRYAPTPAAWTAPLPSVPSVANRERRYARKVSGRRARVPMGRCPRRHRP